MRGSVQCCLLEPDIKIVKGGGKVRQRTACANGLASGEGPHKTPPPYTERSSNPSSIKRDNPPSASKPAKRRKVDEPERDGDDEQDGENHNDKSSSSSSVSKRRLACPFFKRKPSKTRPSCVYPGFSSIARLKEHLYRQHMLPPHRCPRCSTYFTTEACLNEHSRALVPCEVNGSPSHEGITSEQEKALKSKKRSAKSGAINNDEEKWRDIYGILFPEEHIPSPYCDTVSAPPQYEDSLRRGLPSLVYDRLKFSPHNSLHALDDEARDQIKTLVSDCQDEIFSLWHQGVLDSTRNGNSVALVEGAPKQALMPGTPLGPSIDDATNATHLDAIKIGIAPTTSDIAVRVGPEESQWDGNGDMEEHKLLDNEVDGEVKTEEISVSEGRKTTETIPF